MEAEALFVDSSGGAAEEKGDEGSVCCAGDCQVETAKEMETH